MKTILPLTILLLLTSCAKNYKTKYCVVKSVNMEFRVDVPYPALMFNHETDCGPIIQYSEVAVGDSIPVLTYDK